MINPSRSTVIPTNETIASRSDPDKPEPTPEVEQGSEPNEFEVLQQKNERLTKKLGDQGNTIGELRKQLEAMQAQIVSSQQQPDAVETDFYDDPVAAVDRAIDERLAPMQEKFLAERVDQALSAIRKEHSDYDELIQSEGFRDWIEGSRYRQVMAREAEQNLDAQAAIELVSMYKADTDLTPQEAIERDRELRASATESGRGYGGSGARFSWSELRLLQQRDPQRYRALLPQVMQAQKEGRVDP